MKGKKKRYYGIGGKLTGFYVLFGLIPLIIAYLYTFRVLRDALEQDGYHIVSQGSEQVGNQIDAFTDRYAAIIDSIYRDYYLNAYIMADYSESGYENMYPYIDKTMLKLSLLYPESTKIGFYSFNDTLPGDGNYFHRVWEMSDGWFMKAVDAGGFTVVAGIENRKEYGYVKPTICFVKLLNYFKNASLQNVLQVQVDASNVCDLIQTENEASRKLVVNRDGTILATSDYRDIGRNVDELYPAEAWQGEEGEVTRWDHYFMIFRECQMDLRVLMVADEEKVLGMAEQTAKRILLLLLTTAACAIFAILFYIRGFSRRINQIVYAAGRLRRGDFSYFVGDKVNDEVGKVADAMDELTRQMEILIEENYSKQVRIRDSEMNLMYEQIDPHFLYNALGTISSLSIMEGDRMTNRCVKALGEFYRVSLNKGKRIVSVQEEVELLKSYMVIQKFRFEDSIEISYDVKRSTLQFKCLKLLLQPVVENAIKYAIADNNAKALHIQVKVFEDGGDVCFVVEDDGTGMEPEKLREVKAAVRQGDGGFGLKNMDIRIKLQYGEKYGLQIESVKGEGTKVTIRIPRVWKEVDDTAGTDGLQIMRDGEIK